MSPDLQLYNFSTKDEKELKDNINQAEISLLYSESAETIFAIDLIHYVLNEHQIYFESNRFPFVEGTIRLFTADFGKLIMFKKTVAKELYDELLRRIFPGGVLKAENLFFMADNFLRHRGHSFFIGFTLFCTVVSHLCVYCASFGHFPLVNFLTNTLSYEMLKYRYIFSDNYCWYYFQNYVRLCNATQMIAAAA